MAYNYPPGRSMGQNGNYGSFPGAPPGMGAPPSMGAAPGLGGAPGMSPPPGMAASATPLPGRPGTMSAGFQPPPNMPGINFNAPVIRLGVPGGGKSDMPYGGREGRSDAPGGNRGRLGLGADSRTDYNRQPRENTLQPLTKEEVSRTIYVGGLVDGVPNDAVLEELMGIGHGLRKWLRVTDADGKPCTFGFAEYDDAQALELASELFKDIELPLKQKGQSFKEEDGEVKKAKLTIIVDPESVKYISQWTKTNENEFQFKLDTGREDLTSFLASLVSGANTNGAAHMNDGDGDTGMENGQSGGVESIPLPVAGEDELSDIPAEMRETVAAEIAAFRDRSIRRDKERLRQEEEMEAAERQRSLGSRVSRLASPPVAAPTGPGGANGIPVGPRDRTVQGAPAGPKGYRGAQMPRDYADGVTFVDGVKDEDDDDSASDSELERRRKEKKDTELEKIYLDQERRWLQKEKAHFSAVDRQQKEEDAAAAARERRREDLVQRLANFDDEAELRKPTHAYFKDHKVWVRERRNIRGEEKRRDDRDGRDEAREKDAEGRRMAAAQGMADDFLAQQAQEIEARRAPRQPERAAFSLNLGGMGRIKMEDGDEEEKKPRTTLMDVEGLLDDEEDAARGAGAERKPMRPVAFKPLAPGEKMTDEERARETAELAKSIPSNTAELFAYAVKWDSLPDDFVTFTLRKYLRKQIMEALGVQEDMLVELIEGIVARRGTAEEIVRELEVMLDDEAVDMAKKVWRLVVFYSESEAAGLIGPSH